MSILSFNLKILRRIPSPNLQIRLARSLFSKTGVWPRLYNSEVRAELETFWNDKLEDHHRQNKGKHSDREKYYVLSMFPYPSGKLHMGHVRVYAISDAMARYYRLNGKDVIHPMGWDAFGLPAENAAIDRGERPDKWTYSNISHMRKQLKELCLSFDWDREYATCDPEYYRWTQHIFIKMYERGLVYQKEAAVNWDPVDQTVLADEQIDKEGFSWRSGAKAEKRMLRQWYIRTTAYSKSLYDGLEEVDQEMWRDVVALQRNWIGTCDGIRLKFEVQGSSDTNSDSLSIFTRHPEGIYGVSHACISPEHPLNTKTLLKRKLKFGESQVNELTVTARNPVSGETLPIFVLSPWPHGDGIDAVMSIPSLSDSDREFALANHLEYRDIIDGVNIVNSEHLTGMARQDAFSEVCKTAKLEGYGSDLTSQTLRDWLISRQRYWGTPIPMIHCSTCGTQPVPYSDLPVKLPQITDFTGKGSSPLAAATEWKETKCPKCGGSADRETDTMDTFVDSSWYYLRYLDAQNTREPFSKDAASKGMSVDLYIGGKEHAIMHLYYARFFSHFLFDEGLLPQKEPFIHLLTQGMVMGQSYKLKKSGRYIPPSNVKTIDGKLVDSDTGSPVVSQWEKMSKSKHNGADPQEVLEQHGTDATRLCILSGVAPKSDRNWDPEAFMGIYKWQSNLWNKVWYYLQNHHKGSEECTISEEKLAEYEEYLRDSRNYFMKEVNHNMKKSFLLSVAISRLNGLTNAINKIPGAAVPHSIEYRRALCELVIMLSPFSPMYSSELWTGLASVRPHVTGLDWDQSVLEQTWPSVDPDYKLNLKVKVNDKEVFEVRLPMSMSDTTDSTLSRELALSLAQSHPLYEEKVGTESLLGCSLYLEPLYKADLHLRIPEVKKKKKKKDKKQKQAATNT